MTARDGWVGQGHARRRPVARRARALAAKYTATSAAKAPAWKKSSPSRAPGIDALPTTEIPWLSETYGKGKPSTTTGLAHDAGAGGQSHSCTSMRVPRTALETAVRSTAIRSSAARVRGGGTAGYAPLLTSASTSSTDTGTPRVVTSCPSAVTITSSSMRTPTPRSSAGTSSASAGT
jgi:hypothetical protein